MRLEVMPRSLGPSLRLRHYGKRDSERLTFAKLFSRSRVPKSRGFRRGIHAPARTRRSTYVLLSSVALILMFLFWQPLGGSIWTVTNPAGRAVLYTLFAFGFGLVLLSTFLINHFDLFGLRQVWLYLRRRPYTRLQFGTPGPYRFVRHPLYVGWFFAFWATPTMTFAHLLFAVATTSYILIAIQFEERDLVREFGGSYEEYRRRVPMLVPFTKLPQREKLQQAE